MGFRPLAWNSETSLPSSGLIYTYVYLLYSTCVPFQVRVPFLLGDISVSEIVFYLHIWFAVYIGQSLSAQTFRLAFAPKWGLTGTDRCTCLGEGESPLVPLIGSFPDYLALFGLVFGRLLKFDSPRKTRGGGKTTFESPFVQGCAFSPFFFIFFSFDVSPVRTLTNNYCY